jgi:hypothetical protein
MFNYGAIFNIRTTMVRFRASRARLQKHHVGADFMGKLLGFQRSIVHLLIVEGWHSSCYKPRELIAPLA